MYHVGGEGFAMIHTPTPWMQSSTDPCTVIAVENTVKTICDTDIACAADGVNEANAAHIVKCVNNHEELIKMLTFLHQVMQCTSGLFYRDDVGMRVEELLSKVKS